VASKRKVIRGIPISSGIALGHTQVVLPGLLDVAEKSIKASEVDQEVAALEKAVEDTAHELRKLRQSASRKIDGSISKVFDAQLLIATDRDFLNQVWDEIAKQQRNAGFIYNLMVRRYTLQLQSANDPYLRQSAQEIQAVAERVLSHLSGVGEKSTSRFDPETVLVAQSFTPGNILDYRQRRVAGFLACEGGSCRWSWLRAP
jgi:phosphoenolpyruvate-protein kinase (PTS system EI component)